MLIRRNYVIVIVGDFKKTLSFRIIYIYNIIIRGYRAQFSIWITDNGGIEFSI